MDCNEWDGCTYRSELLKPILDEYMPVPDGVNPWDYYDCPECYEAMADWSVWDGVAFGEKLDERILEPARNANLILGEHSYLTRLYTTISPYEMTEDPLFSENPDLEDVPAQRMAQADVDCDDSTIWTLPGGMQVYSPNMDFPDFPGEDPWAMTVEQGTTIGALQPVADMCPQIITSIETHNSQYNYEGHYGECGTNPDAAGETGDDGPGQDDGASRGSCACTAGSRSGGGALAFLLFGGLVLRRRPKLPALKGDT
jgi:MYXO-CTERM domain-containing protein